MLKYLFTWLILCVYADGSHFRGGIITWKPIAPNQIEISYRVSFRYSSGGHYCNSTIIKNGNLVDGEGSLACTYGCSGSIASPMSYYCTDFSDDLNEDWTTGQHIIAYTLNATSDNVFRFGYSSCCWIPLVEGGNSNWKMETTANFSIRHDTGKINTSPISAMAPIVRIQKGCSALLHIPTADDDNDIVKCRWAKLLPIDECGSVCQTLSGSILQQMPCALNYTARGSAGWYGVAIQIEDFEHSNSSEPLSSVSLQFLVNVFESNASCQSKPVVNVNTTGDPPTVKLLLHTTFFQTIIADSGSSDIRITAINTNSPIGMTKSELRKVSTSGTEYYVTVTWKPSSTQTGNHIFCYWAVNSNGQSSAQVCRTLYVAVCPTDIVTNAARMSTGELPGDIVTYTCNPQHVLTSGNINRTCQSDGTWTGILPVCTHICALPLAVSNTAKTQTGDNPSDTISYQCNGCDRTSFLNDRFLCCFIICIHALKLIYHKLVLLI